MRHHFAMSLFLGTVKSFDKSDRLPPLQETRSFSTTPVTVAVSNPTIRPVDLWRLFVQRTKMGQRIDTWTLKVPLVVESHIASLRNATYSFWRCLDGS